MDGKELILKDIICKLKNKQVYEQFLEETENCAS